MKRLFKIVLVVSLFLPNGVYAATYYSNEKTNYMADKPIDKNYEEEYRYKFYEEEKIYSDQYYIEDFNDKSYPYRSNEFIQTDFTDYKKEKPLDVKNRVIKTKEMFEYAKKLPVRYLYFYDINGSKDMLRFLEMKVYHNEEEVTYSLECEKCSNKDKINDGSYNQGYTSFSNKETFILDLNDYYEIDELNLEIYLTDNYGIDKSTFKISALDENKNVLDNYIDVFLESNMYNTEDNGYRFDINLKEYIKDLYYEENKIETEEKLEEEDYKLINQYTLYAYQDIKYKYYKLNKNYLDGYYVEKQGYKKDENKFKIYYKVQDREKIIFKDHYVITSRDYNLYDLIEESSIDRNKIKIEDTININKNGVYKVTFSYQDFKIDQYVTLDLEEMMESIHISKTSNVVNVDKISTETGDKVTKVQKEEKKNEKQNEKNSIFSYLSISMLFLVKKILGV